LRLLSTLPEEFVGLRFGVRIDQPGRLVRDFQTARSLDGTQTMPLSYRFYLADASSLPSSKATNSCCRAWILRSLLALVVILAVIPQATTEPDQTALTRIAAQPDLARPDWTVENGRLAVTKAKVSKWTNQAVM
jgi:CRISPR-associated protein (Cas_Cas5)